MSAILGVFGDGVRADDRVVRRMLLAMRERGTARSAAWRRGGAVLAVARHDWELEAGFSGPVLLVEEHGCVVAADASLYYRDDLRRRLVASGARLGGTSASHLVLAAWRAWGDRCAEELEGDFAFVLWDSREGKAIVGRDSAGTRPLFTAEPSPGLFIVASSIEAILAHPDCAAEVDPTEVAVDAAGLVWAVSDATCFRGIRRVAAGDTLEWMPGRIARRSSSWNPLAGVRRSDAPAEEAAEELRRLLSTAVAERLDPSGPSAVMLSGGRDSTAVFAAGHRALAPSGRGPRLVATSARFPSSDPWCENGMISAAAAHWGQETRWVELDDVPLLDDAERAAGARSEPWTPEYEHFLRALLRSSRSLGCRVAFNGHGGDFLFYNTRVVLADLLAAGRLVELWHEWRSSPGRGGREFFKWAIEPLLPAGALQAAAIARRGRALHGYFAGIVPDWIDRRFAKAHGLHERAASATPRATTGERGLHEIAWLLTRPHQSRVLSALGGFGLVEGVEARAPLLDRRVVSFALGRPASDRRRRGDTKRLLRLAMRDLLPESVLARRSFKTGTLRGYLGRKFSQAAPLLLEISRAPLLAELGIVDRAALRRVVERYAGRTPDVRIGPDLLQTLQAELWLRARAGRPTRIAPMHHDEATMALPA